MPHWAIKLSYQGQRDWSLPPESKSQSVEKYMCFLRVYACALVVKLTWIQTSTLPHWSNYYSSFHPKPTSIWARRMMLVFPLVNGWTLQCFIELLSRPGENPVGLAYCPPIIIDFNNNGVTLSPITLSIPTCQSHQRANLLELPKLWLVISTIICPLRAIFMAAVIDLSSLLLSPSGNLRGDSHHGPTSWVELALSQNEKNDV